MYGVRHTNDINAGIGFIFDYDEASGSTIIDPNSASEGVLFAIEGEISDSKTPNYNSAEVLGASSGYQAYANTSPREVSFNAILYADTNAKEEVHKSTEYLRSFLYPDYSSNSVGMSPPHRVFFSYGERIKIVGIVTGCEVTWFTVNWEGFSLKADVSIAITEVRTSMDKLLGYKDVRRRGEF